jgi:hypothetical protein
MSGTPGPAEVERQVFHDALMARADKFLAQNPVIHVRVDRENDMRDSFRRAGERLGRR